MWEIENERSNKWIGKSLNLGSIETPIEEFVQLAREEVDVEYTLLELLDLAWGREIHFSLDLNKEPMEGNSVDDQPTPIFKHPKACEYDQILSNFAMENPSEMSTVDVMNMQSLWISWNNFQNQQTSLKTINIYLMSVWYDEDIIMGLYLFILNSILEDVVSIFL